tara:strand:+ start:6921 stop:7487 length:567 start_codon:yes stop_codon:yes gene_type:complete
MIIGIAGRMRSGKTTLAKVLVDQYGFHKSSFAGAVRDEVADAMFKGRANPREQLLLAEMRDKNAVRPILQAWGEGKRNLIHPDYWIWKMLEDAANHELVVVDDVRYPNEVASILDNGGYLIRLEVSEETIVDRGGSLDALNHPSEMSILEITDAERSSKRRVMTINTDGRSDYGLWKAAEKQVKEWLK